MTPIIFSELPMTGIRAMSPSNWLTVPILFCLSAVAQGATTTRAYGTWQIVHKFGSSQIVSPEGITSAASAARNAAFGADAFGIPTGNLPAGTTNMQLAFTFKSSGFFTSEPGAHIAVGTTANWQKANVAGMGGFLEGRGIVLGNVEGAPDGCTVGPIVEIEPWRRPPLTNPPTPDIKLYPSSCSALLSENTSYAVNIVADNVGDISYTLHAGSHLISSSSIADSTNYITPGLGGWFMLFVFGDGDQTQADSSWTLTFSNVTVTYY